MEAFDVYPRLFYILLVPPLACAAAGVLIPSAISLWGDIRLPSQMLRRCLLVFWPAGAGIPPAVCHSLHESMAGLFW